MGMLATVEVSVDTCENKVGNLHWEFAIPRFCSSAIYAQDVHRVCMCRGKRGGRWNTSLWLYLDMPVVKRIVFQATLSPQPS